MADCPNSNSRYHECTEQCKDQFGLRSFTHRLEDERKRLRLLRKYPLPPGWSEVGDPTTGRCYYWNSDTDKVIRSCRFTTVIVIFLSNFFKCLDNNVPLVFFL